MLPEASALAPPPPAAPGSTVATTARQPAGVSARSLRRGGLLYSGANFLGLALGFATSLVLVRVVPQRELASYLLLLQATTMLGLVLQLGLAQGALRFAPVARGEGGREATRTVRRRLLGLQLAIWAALAPPAYLLWPRIAVALHAPQLAGAWGWLLATAMLASLSRLLDAYLRAFRFYSSSALLTHLVPRALALAGFAALLLPGVRAELEPVSWPTLMAIFVGSQLAAAVGYILCLPATSAGEASEPRAAQAPPGTWPIFTTTTPMGLRSAAALLMTSSDLWVLSWAHRPEEVAVYGIVSRVIAILGALPLAANFLLPQEFAVLYADGKKAELERLARTAATAVAMLGVFSVGAIVLLGRPVIRLAYGPEYLGGWAVLLVLAIGSFWDGASGSAGYLLQMTGHQVSLLRSTLVAGVANVLLSLALAPRFGGLGVAAATAVSLIGLNLWNVRTARREVGVRSFAYFGRAEWQRVFRLLVRGGRR